MSWQGLSSAATEAWGVVRIVLEKRWVICCVLFAIPIISALVLIGANQWIVPRDQVSGFLGEITLQSATRSPASLATLYHLAIAGAVTLMICIFVVFQCLRFQAQMWADLQRAHIAGLALGLNAFALVAPTVLAIVEPGMIDDVAVLALFESVDLKGVNTSPIYQHDSRILSAIIFTAYFMAAATTALAATSVPIGRVKGTSKLAEERLEVVRNTLLLTSTVLLAAMVTGKLRLDVGLYMLGTPSDKDPTAAYLAYREMANGIANYWAAILSVGLALIYGLPSLRLYRLQGSSSTPTEGLSSLMTVENGKRLLRLLAILSPPLITGLIEAFTRNPS